MDLLRMVISDQKKVDDLSQSVPVESYAKVRGSAEEVSEIIRSMVHRNELMAKRREKIRNKVSALILRMDGLLNEVQQVKRRYKVV